MLRVMLILFVIGVYSADNRLFKVHGKDVMLRSAVIHVPQKVW